LTPPAPVAGVQPYELAEEGDALGVGDAAQVLVDAGAPARVPGGLELRTGPRRLRRQGGVTGRGTGLRAVTHPACVGRSALGAGGPRVVQDASAWRRASRPAPAAAPELLPNAGAGRLTAFRPPRRTRTGRCWGRCG